MSVPTETRVWTLADPPVGAIKPDTFKAETKPLPKESELKDGEIIVKVLALSNDPAQRGRMDGKIDEVSTATLGWSMDHLGQSTSAN
jgi:NADPH-dependent curcumin reductase CurA